MNEGKLGHLERASVLAASDDPKDQDKAREIKTRFDYESLKRQIGSKKKHSKPVVKETTMPNISSNDKKAIKSRAKNLFKRDLKGEHDGVNESVSGGVPMTPQELEIQKKMSKLNMRLARKRNAEMQKAKVQDTETAPEQVKEGSLHKWFKGSKSKDGKKGWVNVVTGGTCASDEPGEGTPKCVSSSKRASMTKAERESASRRKKAADPGQQSKTGAAKPTYVRTDSKKKMKESKDVTAVAKELDKASKMHKGQANKLRKHADDMKKVDEACWKGYKARGMKKKGGKLVPNCKPIGEGKGYQPEIEVIKSKDLKKKERDSKLPPHLQGDALGKMKKAFASTNEEVVAEADKKGSGSGTKDACYHKVKASAKVWPSAYASGRLVQCRKKGASNYGNSKKEEFEGWADDPILEKTAAWTRKAGKNPEGGLNQKGVDSYRRDNPGSKLKTAVTTKPSKLKKGSKSANRRKSFCARMSGMKKKLTSAKTANDPDSRINKSLRKWNCSYEPEGDVINELNRYEKETGKSSGSMNLPKGKPTSKGGTSSPVMRAVRSTMRKETGKPAGQQKKVKGSKSDAGTGKYLDKQKSKQEYASKAKKAGFKSTQDYANTMARYGGEDNYRKGKGLGT